MPDYTELIGQLGAVSLEAKKATREAHEARRDLRAAVAEAKKEIDALMKGRIQGFIEERVNFELEGLGKEVSAHQNQIFQKIISESDKLIEACLGKEGTSQDLRPILARAAQRIAIYERLHEEDDRRRGKPQGRG